MAARVAFATHAGFPNLTDDDRLAAAALIERGVNVEAVLWNDPAENWSDYSAVVIRSCWDYHLMPGEFRSWLDRLDSENVRLCNPSRVLRWNMDKTYLSDLQARGIPVLDSVWLDPGEPIELAELLRRKNWETAVVKPAISAAAHRTELVSLDTAFERQAFFETLIGAGGVIVQDFAEEIRTEGEWSLVFFDKRYSHAVIKRPQNGDFRVQRDFGGTAHPVEAPAHLIDQARSILNRIEDDLLYARVDGIQRDGRLFLMELELIEPHLFFESHSQSAENFATALIEKMSGKE